MNCTEARRLVYDYLNGELPELDHQRVESHLKVCPSCMRVFELERRFQDFVVKQAPQETAPPHLRSAILDRIDQLDRPKTSFAPARKLRLFRPALVLAPIGLVVVFLTIVFFTARQTSDDLLEILIQNHIRAGASAEVLTYISSDPESVATRLAGELGLHPSIAAFVDSEVLLKGGCVLPVCNCKVGLVYFSSEGTGISLFVCRPTDLSCPKMETLRRHNREYHLASAHGHNIVLWEEENRKCIAISRLQRESLLEFADRSAGRETVAL
jgi:anti-sigma factor (TIGR02949 family)